MMQLFHIITSSFSIQGVLIKTIIYTPGWTLVYNWTTLRDLAVHLSGGYYRPYSSSTVRIFSSYYKELFLIPTQVYASRYPFFRVTIEGKLLIVSSWSPSVRYEPTFWAGKLIKDTPSLNKYAVKGLEELGIMEVLNLINKFGNIKAEEVHQFMTHTLKSEDAPILYPQWIAKSVYFLPNWVHTFPKPWSESIFPRREIRKIIIIRWINFQTVKYFYRLLTRRPFIWRLWRLRSREPFVPTPFLLKRVEPSFVRPNNNKPVLSTHALYLNFEKAVLEYASLFPWYYFDEKEQILRINFSWKPKREQDGKSFLRKLKSRYPKPTLSIFGSQELNRVSYNVLKKG